MTECGIGFSITLYEKQENEEEISCDESLNT